MLASIAWTRSPTHPPTPPGSEGPPPSRPSWARSHGRRPSRDGPLQARQAAGAALLRHLAALGPRLAEAESLGLLHGDVPRVARGRGVEPVRGGAASGRLAPLVAELRHAAVVQVPQGPSAALGCSARGERAALARPRV